MFTGFTQETVDFMWGVRFNNNKTWFTENKSAYQQHFLAPMKELGAQVFEGVKDKCGDRGFIHKVSRIYKDARRVRDGAPYRDNMWFSIERPSEQWTATPVFWFELSPEMWRYGLGYYSVKALTMAKFRARIDANPKAFEKLVAPLEKRTEFVVDGDEYVRRKTAPTKKTDSWYNKKSVSLINSNPLDERIFEPSLAQEIIDGIAFLMPLYDYLITLDNDPDPRDIV